MSTSIIKKPAVLEFQIKTMSGTFPANSQGAVQVQAEIPDGWKFLHWVSANSTGWVGYIYCTWPNASKGTFWTTTKSENERTFNAHYLLYR